MAIRYYDEALCKKIENWVGGKIRVIPPSDVSRLLQVKADANNDKPIKLPFVALSRDSNIHLDVNTRRNMTYDGLKLGAPTEAGQPQLNAIPVSLSYQLDIYTQKYDEADAYLREFLFNLINYPRLKITLPYNNAKIEQIANLVVNPDIVDNSDVQSRLYIGQFTRWTIQLELQDAYIYNIPISKGYTIDPEGNINILETEVIMDESIDIPHNGFTHIKEESN